MMRPIYIESFLQETDLIMTEYSLLSENYTTGKSIILKRMILKKKGGMNFKL